MRRREKGGDSIRPLAWASRGALGYIVFSMRSRRVLIFGAMLLLGAVTARAAAETAPLRVTYYYLPG